MIKKLRRKLIAVAMLSLFLVLLIIVGTVNVLNYNKLIKEADSTLSILMDNNGIFPKPDMHSGGVGDFFKGMSPEKPYETRYFSVLMNDDGTVNSVDTGRIAGTDTDKAIEYAKEVSKSGRTSGFIQDYRYAVKSADKGVRIIFLYCQRELENFRSVLIISSAISVCGMLAVFVLLLFFSGRIVKPVSESYEKQKRFITDAGHEIKTPLTIIDADADIIEMEHGESEWLSDIKKQTRRLTMLTNDLIYLAKMEENSGSVNKLEFPLSDMVEETAESFKSLAISRSKTFTYTIQPLLSYVGDEKALRQLVSILLDNAIKYSDENGNISVTLSAQGRGIRLEFFNTCASMPKDSTSHLFERFYRGEESHNSQTGGYGIGLSVAKAVVDAHKGRITASTKDEHSLTVTVLLPC